ncbi:unnamed protein product [Arabidopsis halleri]
MSEAKSHLLVDFRSLSLRNLGIRVSDRHKAPSNLSPCISSHGVRFTPLVLKPLTHHQSRYTNLMALTPLPNALVSHIAPPLSPLKLLAVSR